MTETPNGQDTPSAEADAALEEQTTETRFSLQGLIDTINWSPRHDALGKWKQTDLLRGMPLTWIAPAGLDPVTGIDPELEDPTVGPIWLEDDFDAIICSQTCDLGAGPPGDNHPTVLIAPLIHEDDLGSNKRRSDAGKGILSHLVRVLPADPDARAAAIEAAQEDRRVRAARKNSINASEVTDEHLAELGPLNVTDIPKGHRWYADLRILVPVSKGLLVDREPAGAFLTEDESLTFGEILAQKFRRPALHEALSEELPKVLETYVQNAGYTTNPFAKVDEVRLSILEGDRLNPVRGQLIIITENGALTPDEQAAWTDLNKSASRLFDTHGINYANLVHWDISNMQALLYRNTVPVKCRYLGHTRRP